VARPDWLVKISKKLYERGYKVEILVRSKKKKQISNPMFGIMRISFWKNVRWIILIFSFIWQVLPSANAGQILTKEIYRSRVDSAQFIYERMFENDIHPEAVISASAVGFYGQVTSEHIFSEEDLPAQDFLVMFVRIGNRKPYSFRILEAG
jgi:NAD dependent epimerase/dehydratase family enzyme